MHRIAWITAVLAVVAGALVAATPAASPNFPTKISFPPGWRGEGIAVGRGSSFYAGDTTTGAIYAGDLRTGEGSVLVPARAGGSVFGLMLDNENRIFAAGGRNCDAFVYDAATGTELAHYVLTAPPCFINDVFVTRTAAYFTNTDVTRPVLFKIPIAPNGDLGAAAETFVTTPPVANTNGIEATADGSTLITIKFTLGQFVKVDAETGVATDITVTENGVPTLVPRADGLILHGTTLYAVQNLPVGSNVTVIRLSPDLNSGEIVARLNSDDETDPLVSAATADRFGHLLYVVRRKAPAPAPVEIYLSRITLPGD